MSSVMVPQESVPDPGHSSSTASPSTETQDGANVPAAQTPQQLTPQQLLARKHSRSRSQRSTHSRAQSYSTPTTAPHDPAVATSQNPAQAHGQPLFTQSSLTATPSQKRNVQKRRSIGDWDFNKKIGAGSMGQVKLATNRVTGTKCAVKVVPRACVEHRSHPASNNDPSSKKESDESKDIRTVREGAIAHLLHHKYICQLYEMYTMTSNYYMLFEYVGGGQMLDYIVARGYLKEKHAREFCRMIASALDYCHHNSIVHRGMLSKLFPCKCSLLTFFFPFDRSQN